MTRQDVCMQTTMHVAGCSSRAWSTADGVSAVVGRTGEGCACTSPLGTLLFMYAFSSGAAPGFSRVVRLRLAAACCHVSSSLAPAGAFSGAAAQPQPAKHASCFRGPWEQRLCSVQSHPLVGLMWCGYDIEIWRSAPVPALSSSDASGSFPAGDGTFSAGRVILSRLAREGAISSHKDNLAPQRPLCC
jgi:hypothetical protein